VIELQSFGGAMFDNPFTIECQRTIDPHRIDAAAKPAALEG
jgi:hypothetical protein